MPDEPLAIHEINWRIHGIDRLVEIALDDIAQARYQLRDLRLERKELAARLING